MKLLVFLGVLAAVATFSVEGKSRSHIHTKRHKDFLIQSRENYDHIDYYDCEGKRNGNYIHPEDCTRFITCSNGYASDMACPDCNLPNSQCLGEKYLRYDLSRDQCLYPEQVPCVAGPQDPETTSASPTTTTTTTDKTTTTEEPEVTTPDDPETTTTEDDNETPHVCNGIQEGDPCDEDQCQPCGYCWELHSYYFMCNRTFPSDPKLPITGEYVHLRCDTNLWWNPDKKPEGVHDGWGGACDHWENLSAEVQNAYKSDRNCVQPHELCEFGQDNDQKCTGVYWFFDPKTMDDRIILRCSDDLVWDPESETCRSRSNVKGC